MISPATLALAGLLALNHFLPALSHGLRSMVSGNLPRLFLVTTTQEVASKYGSHWNLLPHEASQHVLDESEDLIQLQILVGDEEEADYLEHLETAGVLSYEQVDTDHSSSHADRFLRYDNKHFNDRNIVVAMRDESDLSCYRTVDETYDSMDALAEKYWDFVRVETIGESWIKTQSNKSKSSSLHGEGYGIKIMVLSAPSNYYTKHDMMVVAGHHSRELPPPEVVLRWAEHLLDSYGKDADITWILERTNIHIVPIANPDGRAIAQEHLEWWKRRNAHPYGCTNGTAFEGVDLNRQYPFMWGHDSGSSGDPCNDCYRGPEPLSEPESQAVYHYAHNLFADEFKRGDVNVSMANMNVSCSHDATGIFIDVHSCRYGEKYVYFPYGFADITAPDHRSLLTMASKLSTPGNYSLWGPQQAGFKYYVSGDCTDALYGIDCIPAFGFETGSQFYASCTSLEEETIPTMFEALLYAAKSVSAPYKIPLGPDLIDVCVDNTNPQTTTMTVRVSDEALIVGHTIFDGELSQAIKKVQVFLDAHPFDDGSQGNIMEPMDGVFDSAEELATYSLDTSSWEGRHILYFQATDSHDNAGPVSAVYVDNNEPNACQGVLSASQ